MGWACVVQTQPADHLNVLSAQATLKHGLWIWAQPQRAGGLRRAQGAPVATMETPMANTNTQASSRGATVSKKRPRPKYEVPPRSQITARLAAFTALHALARSASSPEVTPSRLAWHAAQLTYNHPNQRLSASGCARREAP